MNPILTRIWVFLAMSALLVGSFALHAAGQDSLDSSKQQGGDDSPAADGKTGGANDAAGSDPAGKGHRRQGR